MGRMPLKLILSAIAGLLGVGFVLFSQRPAETTSVLLAVRDIEEGATIALADVRVTRVETSRVIRAGYLTKADEAIGLVARISRNAGDILYPTDVTAEIKGLAEGEVEIGVTVNDTCGMAGLISPGDIVGLIATFNLQGGGVYSKYITGGLRVTYVDPTFRAKQGVVLSTPTGSGRVMGGIEGNTKRSKEGVVLLAIQTDAMVVFYDWTQYGFSATESPRRLVYAVELIPALAAGNTASFCFAWEGENTGTVDTSGLYLQNLIVMPSTPTPSPMPTATETLFGFFIGTPTEQE